MSINLLERIEASGVARSEQRLTSERAPFAERDAFISRSELKFSISEDTAVQIRKTALLSMKLDPHCSAADGNYEVHTMYLDSTDMAIYRKSLKREVDRFKLRIRFYDDDPASPVFLEVKKSASGLGTKMRVAVERETANTLFASNDHLTVVKATNSEFWELANRFNARPIIHIGYVREAFVGRDDPNTRLTLDRMIQCEAAPSELTTAMRDPIHIWPDKVILEIKYAGGMPCYIRDLIRQFHLETIKASKYMQSVGSGLTTTQTFPHKSVVQNTR